jgi:hypothetical protein
MVVQMSKIWALQCWLWAAVLCVLALSFGLAAVSWPMNNKAERYMSFFLLLPLLIMGKLLELK